MALALSASLVALSVVLGKSPAAANEPVHRDESKVVYQGEDLLGGESVELSEVLAQGRPVVAVLFRRAVFKWLRLLRPYVHPLSAMFLVGAGVYLIYYYALGLRP